MKFDVRGWVDISKNELKSWLKLYDKKHNHLVNQILKVKIHFTSFNFDSSAFYPRFKKV